MFTLSDTIPQMKDLADRLIKARTDKGMTQGELATAAGVSQSTIGNLESRLRLTARKLAVIAKVLGVNAYWLETGEGDPHASSDELLDQVAALSPAERSIVAALVTSLRGVSVGTRPGAKVAGDQGELSAYEQRILGLLRQMSERAKVTAEDQLQEILRTNQEFSRLAPETTADIGRRKIL